MITQQVSIYALINPIDETVFYVGCTSCVWSRLNQHISESRLTNRSKASNHHKCQIIQEIKQSGHDLELLVLEKCDISEASFWEEFYIDLFKSFGFHLPQMKKSNYGGLYKDRTFLSSDRGRHYVNLTYEVTDGIKLFCKTFHCNRDFFIRVAVIELLKKHAEFTENPTGESFLKARQKLHRDYNFFK